MRWSLPTLLLLAGCGSTSFGTGDLGRLTYSLHSDFLAESASLRDVSVLVRHEQTIGVGLTELGEEGADEPEDIEHRIEPAEGVTLSSDGAEDGVPSVHLTVEIPGDYVLESTLDGDAFDRIPLRFAEPVGLDLVTWARTPGAEDWERVEDGASLPVGTQAAFVPIPLDSLGERIAGDLDFDVASDPDGAIAPVQNVLGAYEQNVVTSAGPRSAVLVAEGAVVISVVDEPNGVLADRGYTVTP